MVLSRYLSTGSNTTIVSGPGRIYGVIAGGANGGSVIVADTLELGVTPNLVAFPTSNPSNLTFIGPLDASGSYWPLSGIPFIEGLSVAATSSPHITVIYADE